MHHLPSWKGCDQVPKLLVPAKLMFFAYTGPNQEAMPLATSNTSHHWLLYVQSSVLIFNAGTIVDRANVTRKSTNKYRDILEVYPGELLTLLTQSNAKPD